MRTRLRVRSDVDYQVERTNDAWPDHVLRTLTSAAHIAWRNPTKVIDPACGDASIVRAANALQPINYAVLNDVGKPNIDAIRRWLPTTLGWETLVGDAQLLLESQSSDIFDVVVLTEFLEHVDDPVHILREAARVGKHLVASSPEMRPGQVDYNSEHVWMFDGDGYREMLIEGGWTPIQKTFLGFPGTMYDFQIWACDRAADSGGS